MPFWRARLSAKRFIAGVGGCAAAPLPTAAPSKGTPPAAAPSLSLPMMRWATSHTASIAPTISCLPTTTSSSRLPLVHQKALFLKPADDLGSGRWRADALGFLQALAQHLILNEPPGILHRLDQGAFVVTRRWPCLLVLDFWILQSRSLTVAQRWK